jgi:hypothetical protein
VNLRGVGTNPVDPADTLAEFLRALGVAGSSIPVGLEERARLYRTRLADRRLLVVLDNASDEAQVRPLLPGTSSCTVLVTSRASLAGLEGVASLTLDALAPAEALALLATIAGAKRVEAEPEAAAAIIERCGHLPLAVRIAGARLAAKRHWRLSYLADRLRGRRRLHELKVGDLDVAASIALSYAGLSQPERRAFRLLAVLDAPDFPAWVAGAVLNANLAETEELIERLVDAHLLEVAGRDPDGGCRYRFHDLVRDFARVRLQRGSHAAGGAALERALAAYLTVAEQARMALEPGGLRTFCRPDTPGWDVDSPDIVESVEHRPLDWFAVERRSLLAATRTATQRRRSCRASPPPCSSRTRAASITRLPAIARQLRSSRTSVTLSGRPTRSRGWVTCCGVWVGWRRPRSCTGRPLPSFVTTATGGGRR